MSLSTYYLEYGRHVGQLRRRCRRCAYAPTSNTASHDNHEKINSWVSFSFLYEYGALLGGPSELRYYCVQWVQQSHTREGKKALNLGFRVRPQPREYFNEGLEHLLSAFLAINFAFFWLALYSANTSREQMELTSNVSHGAWRTCTCSMERQAVTHSGFFLVWRRRNQLLTG